MRSTRSGPKTTQEDLVESSRSCEQMNIQLCADGLIYRKNGHVCTLDLKCRLRQYERANLVETHSSPGQAECLRSLEVFDREDNVLFYILRALVVRHGRHQK